MLTRRNKQGAQQVAATGGMMDEAGQVVNGTEVPAGSLTEEVADDVPAMLSEGEFVVPADVVRYVGLERLMKMRDKAKEGLERMDEMGQMGNAEEVDNPDQQFAQADDIAFESEIDSIVAEVDKDGAAMQTEQMFAAGGYVTGTDLSKAPANPAVDVRYYKHADGRVMYITFINDKPMTAIPEGFSAVSAEDARQVGIKAETRQDAAAKATSPTDSSSGSMEPMGDPYVRNDDPLDIMRQAENVTKVSKVVDTVSPFLGVLGMVGAPALRNYAKGQREAAVNTVETQLTPMGAGPLGDFTSVKDMTDQFGNNTGVMNGYFLAATDPFTSSVFNDLVKSSGAQDLTPEQVGVIGLAIDNRVKEYVASDPNMSLADAQAKARADFSSSTAAPESQPTAPATPAAPVEPIGGSGNGFLDGQGSDTTPAGATRDSDNVTRSTTATIEAQNREYFGEDYNKSGDYSPSSSETNSNDGTYCCSRMVHLGEWTETKELARMHIWHHKQPEWWKAGYSVWGKVVANTLFKKKGFWTDVMNAFYARHIKNQPRTLKSVIADLVIYPGVFVCSMIWRNAPETTRYVPEDEMK